MGKQSGEREYTYLESMLRQSIEGILRSFSCGQDESYVLGLDPTALNPILLKAAENEGNSERKFLLFLTLAVQCAKAGEYAKIAEYSRKAVLLKPDDLLANFILAQAQERMGAGKEALKAYGAALRDPLAQSPQLKDFISAQIMRVKTEGPSKASKFHGLRYMTW
jgi:tetratricopeptide (TPR) repeat protein